MRETELEGRVEGGFVTEEQGRCALRRETFAPTKLAVTQARPLSLQLEQIQKWSKEDDLSFEAAFIGLFNCQA